MSVKGVCRYLGRSVGRHEVQSPFSSQTSMELL